MHVGFGSRANLDGVECEGDGGCGVQGTGGNLGPSLLRLIHPTLLASNRCQLARMMVT